MADVFVPPQFSKFGKKVNDLLFKKKYDFKHELKTIHKGPNDITLEFGAFGTTAVNGYSKATYKNKSFGEIEAEVHTSGKGKVKGLFNKFYSGWDITVTGTTGPDSVNADANYEMKGIALNGALNRDAKNARLSGSAVVGTDGFSVGGSGQMDLTAGNGNFDDYNVGVEYSAKDFAVTVTSKNRGTEVVAGYFQQVTGDTAIGASFDLLPSDGGHRNLTLGAEHKLDKATTVKVRGDTDGALAAAVEHRLASPSLLLGLSASVKTKNGLTFDKVGVSVSLGDY